VINKLVVLNFESTSEILKLDLETLNLTIQTKCIFEQFLPMELFIVLYKVVLAFESVDEILKCDHPNESY